MAPACCSADLIGTLPIEGCAAATLIASASLRSFLLRLNFAYAVVVVNDGCPFDETDHVCREFAVANPKRIYWMIRLARPIAGCAEPGS
jgi:hypothetical protein